MKPNITNKTKISTRKYHLFRLTAILEIVGYISLLMLSILLIRSIFESKCDESYKIDRFPFSFPWTSEVQISPQQLICFKFNGNVDEEYIFKSNAQIEIIAPDRTSLIVRGEQKYRLLTDGTYQVKIIPVREETSAGLEFSIDRANENIQPWVQPSNPPPLAQGNIRTAIAPNVLNELRYNAIANPPFKTEGYLEEIVEEILRLVRSRGFSTNNLSVSLVDLKSQPCCSYASYFDRTPRYPASLTKLFWLVALYSQYHNGILPVGTVPENEVFKMIQDSDNESASRVVDLLTQTESGPELSDRELSKWIEQREWINRFFQRAGYQDLNLSQKNFPIPHLQMDEPKNRDLQIRQTHSPVVRNSLTTHDVARLLYEIDTGQAISPAYSQKIKNHLWRDLNPDVWQQDEYNSIAGFLAEYLPVDAYVASKVGWYSGSRQDAAIIADRENRIRYILVVFGDDEGYAEDWQVFPEISRMVYDQMLNASGN